MVPHGFHVSTHRRPRFTALVALGLGVIVASGAACDKMPLLAPTGTVITLISSSNVLALNGTADITAILVENGSTSTGTGAAAAAAPAAGTPVHNGTVVNFTTSIGRIEPAEGRTTNGRVTVKLISDGRSGKATVTAYSGGASKTLEVVVGAAAAARVLVTMARATLPADGGTTEVTAKVEETDGNPVPGIPVTFSTTAGTLSASTVVTDSGGFARTTLTTTKDATVTATAGAQSSSAAVKVSAQTTVSITPPATVSVSTPAIFTVTVGANTTISNVDINWGDGSPVQPLGAVSGSQSVQHVFDDADTFFITATARDTDGGSRTANTSVAVAPLNPIGSCSPASGPLGTPVTVSVSGLPAGVQISGYEWTFFDEIPAKTIPSVGPQIQHVFKQRGDQEVAILIHPTYGSTISIRAFCSVT